MHPSFPQNSAQRWHRAIPLSVAVNFALWSVLSVAARHSISQPDAIEVQRVVLGRSGKTIKAVSRVHSARRASQLHREIARVSPSRAPRAQSTLNISRAVPQRAIAPRIARAPIAPPNFQLRDNAAPLRKTTPVANSLAPTTASPQNTTPAATPIATPAATPENTGDEAGNETTQPAEPNEKNDDAADSTTNPAINPTASTDTPNTDSSPDEPTTAPQSDAQNGGANAGGANAQSGAEKPDAETPSKTGPAMVAPTATPQPQPTATPTAKPTPTIAPTATPKPEPTATPRPKPTATPRPEPTATPRPTGPTRDAIATREVQPSISEELAAKATSRSVRVRFSISTDGSSEASLRGSSGNSEIDDAVLSAANRWRWKAALRNGEPVSSSATIRFSIK